MENLKRRIKITNTVVDDGNASLVYGQKIIMDNQVVIMEALLKLQEVVDDIPRKRTFGGMVG